MGTFRTLKTQKEYDEYKLTHTGKDECWICGKDSILLFKYWRIVENSFPYDLFTVVHHMLVPISHSQEHNLSKEELLELSFIREKILNNDYEYQFILQSTRKHQTVPGHYHIHLLVSK